MKRFVAAILILAIFALAACDSDKAKSIQKTPETTHDSVKSKDIQKTPKITCDSDNAKSVRKISKGKLIQIVSSDGKLSSPTSLVWSNSSTEDAYLNLDYKFNIKPRSIVVGRDHPNGVKILAEFPKYRVHLPMNIDEHFGGFGDAGELCDDFYIQVAGHDFDNDGNPEIIVAIGNGLIDLSVNVIKYHAPESKEDAPREENWELVGSFSGQEKVIITDQNTIAFPYGGVGLFDEYTWVKKKFLKTQ